MRRFDLCQLCALTVCLGLVMAAVLLGACGDTPTPPEPPARATSELPCEPACPAGQVCLDGTCHFACDLVCPEGTHCTADGLCEGDLADGPGGDFAENPCGGTAALPGLPGEACGPCGLGRYVCETEDRVYCVDPEGTNGCGGCEELPGEPLAACGEALRWACLPEGGMDCLPFLDVNPCGGAEPLALPPGRACGECGAGYAVCDGHQSTRCFEAPAPSGTCACTPGVTRPVPCGTDAGACERGLRFCQADGSFGDCVIAEAGEACAGDEDCAPGAWCVDEALAPAESLDDECVEEGDLACRARRCRAVSGTRGCASDADCAPTQGCGQGFCHPLAARPSEERCNGLDDDCDGRVDNDDQRLEVCGACPFNMRLVLDPSREGERRWYCIDHYEASRADATADSAGERGRYAVSRPGVLPWTALSAEEAVAACAGVDYNAQVPGGVPVKRLCLLAEWELTCEAEQGWDFPYGPEYVAGACHDAALGEEGPSPTGSVAECVAVPPGGGFPAYDLSGNVAEWVRGSSGAVAVGGDFTSGEDALACTSAPVALEDVAPDARLGFRCCATPDLSPEATR